MLGHPCCAVFWCMEPLPNNKHWFCATHENLDSICAIVECNMPIVIGTKSCIRADHQEMECLYYQEGQSNMTLEDRLRKHRMGNTTDAHPSSHNIDNDLDDVEQWYELDCNGFVQMHSSKSAGSVGVCDDVPCEATKTETGNKKIKAQYGRRRTHNEQTLVHPCGVIFAQATSFGAEAVSNVLVCFSSAVSNYGSPYVPALR